MRWFIVRLSDGVLPAFVVAECVDEAWAKDSLHIVDASAVLSEDEIGLDPDLAPSLEAWNRRDDSAYQAFLSAEDAATVVHDAEIAEMFEQERWSRDTTQEDGLRGEMMERHRELEQQLRGYEEKCGAETGASYYVGLEAWDRLFILHSLRGADLSARIARDLARGFGWYAHRLSGHRPL